MKNALIGILTLLTWLPTSQAKAYSIALNSGEIQIAQVELFSSEGCDSCPPADAWMSSLKTNPNLWKTFVPLVFHVNYWDYLGWKDNLAKPEFTERQKFYVESWGNNHMYTPGFVLRGLEWIQWRSSTAPILTAAITVGNLKVEQKDKNTFTIEFSPNNPATSYQIYGAVLGMGAVNNVTSGENKGKKLKHDFVVLEMTSSKALYLNKVAKSTLNFSTSDIKTEKRAIAIWVTEQNQIKPIQSVGGYIE